MKHRKAFLALIVTGTLTVPQMVLANINLELRPASQIVNVGDPADVGLYAVSDSTGPQLMSAADVMITWDPAYLHLLGGDQTGAASAGGFFPLADPWGNINQPVDGFNVPTSGTGFYSILAGFGSPVAATPAGTLITTFLLDALAPTPLTVFSVVLNAGNGGKTTVYDGTIPNFDVTGTLGHADITILPEPGTLSLLLVGAAAIGYRRRR